MIEPLKPDPDCACDACGQFGAFRFETEALCAECVAGRGSCCSAEFSGTAPVCARKEAPPQAAAAGRRSGGERAV